MKYSSLRFVLYDDFICKCCTCISNSKFQVGIGTRKDIHMLSSLRSPLITIGNEFDFNFISKVVRIVIHQGNMANTYRKKLVISDNFVIPSCREKVSLQILWAIKVSKFQKRNSIQLLKFQNQILIKLWVFIMRTSKPSNSAKHDLMKNCLKVAA